jgi:tetratricopeptide (TPR) repeat protein
LGILTALAAFVVVAVPPDASTTQAKAHFEKAERLYQRAQYAEAIAEFEAAYRIRPHGVLLYNVGRCYEQLGDIPHALRNYRGYLREVPNAPDRETIEAAIGSLERRLRTKGVQQLLVYATPDAARVALDGRDLGTSPVSAEVVPGSHHLAVSLDGFSANERDFVMPADKSLELEVSMTRAAEVAQAPAPPPLVTVPNVEPAPPFVSAHPAPVAPRKWTFVSGGVGVAGLAVGVGFGIAANNAHAKLVGQMHKQPTVQNLYNDAANDEIAANAAYAVAGVAAVTAVVLFFLEPRLGSAPSER